MIYTDLKNINYKLKSIDADIALQSRLLGSSSLLTVRDAEKRLEKLRKQKAEIEKQIEDLELFKAQGTE